MLAKLLPGDLVLIINPIYIGEKTGQFVRNTRDGMLIQHIRNTYSITFWYPRNAAVLLGRLHV